MEHMKRNNFYEIIRLLRPKQWIKNLFIFAALIFSNHYIYLQDTIKAILVFIAFSMISSCVYIINDLVDIESDKLHPKKRLRPLACGSIKKYDAIVIFLILGFIGFFLAFYLNIYLACIVGLYFLINILYSFWLKHLVIIDVLTISIGFVLRVVAGAVIINVYISPWILVCAIFLSLFLGFNKRKNEIVLLEGEAKNHRKILDDYSIELLNQILPVVTSCTILSYALYTFTGAKTVYMMGTIPFVLYGIFRYLYLNGRNAKGESIETIVLSDMPLIINIFLWVIGSILILYLNRF